MIDSGTMGTENGITRCNGTTGAEDIAPAGHPPGGAAPKVRKRDNALSPAAIRRSPAGRRGSATGTEGVATRRALRGKALGARLAAQMPFLVWFLPLSREAWQKNPEKRHFEDLKWQKSMQKRQIFSKKMPFLAPFLPET